MKGKLLITTIILSIVLFSGCVNSDIPTDKPIVLSKDNPSFDVIVRSDNSKLTWTIDNKSRTDDLSGDINTAHYLLEYKDIPVGNHILKAEDSENGLEWEVQVIGTPEEQAQNGIKENSDGHYPTWEEQIRIANEKKKAANK